MPYNRPSHGHEGCVPLGSLPLKSTMPQIHVKQFMKEGALVLKKMIMTNSSLTQNLAFFLKTRNMAGIY